MISFLNFLPTSTMPIKYDLNIFFSILTDRIQSIYFYPYGDSFEIKILNEPKILHKIFQNLTEKSLLISRNILLIPWTQPTS